MAKIPNLFFLFFFFIILGIGIKLELIAEDGVVSKLAIGYNADLNCVG